MGGVVTFKPEAFVPEITTTTTARLVPKATVTRAATSSETSTATSTVTSTFLGQLPISAEVVTTTEAASTETTMPAADILSGPPWWCFGVAAVAAGGTAALVVLLFQKTEKSVDAPAPANADVPAAGVRLPVAL